jgi:CRISPR-associated endonuclease Csn1
LFTISPGDLVYLPSTEERKTAASIDLSNPTKDQNSRIFIMKKTSGKQCYFLAHNISTLIKKYDADTKYGEFETQNKIEKTDAGTRIKDYCLKLKTDRLGKLTVLK